MRREVETISAAAPDDELSRVPTRVYVESVTRGRLDSAGQRRIGFPWSPDMVVRSRRSVGGTLAACRSALEHGSAVNLAGGTHHAFRERGEGYCVFNDAAVAIRTLQHERAVERVLVVDCDVHQGNGTARIFAGDDAVFTYDVFASGNFPFRKEPSDLDVALPDGTRDDRYLDALSRSLPAAIDRARPDLAIYVSGADAYEDDRLGRLALTKEGLAARDREVLGSLAARGVPVAAVMAGGYARRITDTVDIHYGTVRVALGG
jgi:acetoin utilization deacetylase AcuC-like enzyme